MRHRECVVNVPGSSEWERVEALAPLTSADPVPSGKRDRFRHEKDKFKASGFTAIRSRHVLPDRIAECPLQIESRVVELRLAGERTRFAIIELKAATIHAHEEIILDDAQLAISWKAIPSPRKTAKRLAPGHLQCPEPLYLPAVPTVFGVSCRVVGGCSSASVGQRDLGTAENVLTGLLGPHEVLVHRSRT